MTLIAVWNCLDMLVSLPQIRFSGPPYSRIACDQWERARAQLALFAAISQPAFEKISRCFPECLHDPD
jgi:hypothetical protein